jgi:hypothetical protein
MLVGNEINIDNVPEDGMKDMFSNLMKKIVENMDKLNKEGYKKKKLNINLEVIPMFGGLISTYSLRLSSSETDDKKRSK